MLAEDRVGWGSMSRWRLQLVQDDAISGRLTDQLGWSGADAGLKIDQIWNTMSERWTSQEMELFECLKCL